MSFNSYIFVLLLLPFSVIGYHILNYYHKYKTAIAFLLVTSFIFYGYYSLKYLCALIISILINFIIFKLEIKKKTKSLLIIGILFNVGLLFYFKYFNFFIETINLIFKTNYGLIELFLPLAISFYTFSQISVIVDAYNTEIGDCSILEYSLYVSYFPKLIQGPITSGHHFIKQLYDENKKIINYDNLAKGIFSFCLGMAKKILIADIFAKAVNYGYSALYDLNSIDTLIVIIAYYIQIYFDFSGYSDMARGISLMLNIELPENFNSPYKAVNIGDYWKRWHMSLTSFLTKYIYIPLGGNRNGKTKTYINTLIVFIISGLWHGANWTFVLWGLMNGVSVIVYKMFKKQFDSLPKIIGWFLTAIFVICSWVVFRANSIGDAILVFKNILEFNISDINPSIYNCFWLNEISVVEDLIFGRTFIGPKIYMLVYFFIVIYVMYFSKNNKEIIDDFKPNIVLCLICAVLLVWSILSFSGISTFIYEGF